MRDLTPEERESVALMLSDALTPHGRDFDPEEAARLIEARLTVLLHKREQLGRIEAAGDGSACCDGRDPAGVTAETLRRSSSRIRHDVEFGQAHGDDTFLLAVAEWLDAADADYDPEFPEDAESWAVYQKALAVARAYLGEFV